MRYAEIVRPNSHHRPASSQHVPPGSDLVRSPESRVQSSGPSVTVGQIQNGCWSGSNYQPLHPHSAFHSVWDSSSAHRLPHSEPAQLPWQSVNCCPKLLLLLCDYGHGSISTSISDSSPSRQTSSLTKRAVLCCIVASLLSPWQYMNTLNDG